MRIKTPYIRQDTKITICIPLTIYNNIQNDIEQFEKIKMGGTFVLFHKYLGGELSETKIVACYGKDDVLSKLKPEIKELHSNYTKLQTINKELQNKLDELKKLSWWYRLFNYKKMWIDDKRRHTEEN